MHFVYTTFVIYLVALLSSAGPIAHSRSLHKRDEPENGPLSSSVTSRFAPSTAITSSHIGASVSLTATGHSSKATAIDSDSHSSSTSSFASSKTADTSHSIHLLTETYSEAHIMLPDSTTDSESEVSAPTVMTMTITSTVIPSDRSTGISSRAQWHTSVLSGLFTSGTSTAKATGLTSHLSSTTHSTGSSTSIAWKVTAASPPAGSSRARQSSHLLGVTTAATGPMGSTGSSGPTSGQPSHPSDSYIATGVVGSTGTPSPTIGVIGTLSGAGTSGISTGVYQSSMVMASASHSQTSTHLASGTASNTYTPNPWNNAQSTASRAAASHTDTSYSKADSKPTTTASITQSPFTGVPTNQAAPTPQITGTFVSEPGIVIIIPGSSTSQFITIPLNPSDGIPVLSASSISTQAHSTRETTSHSIPPTQNTALTHSPQGTGLSKATTSFHLTSTGTTSATVGLTRTKQTSSAVPTHSGSSPTGSAATQAPDKGGSLVVNPVSPMFLSVTVTETKTLTETITVATMTMTVTATVTSY
ncbi:hypothetical protein ETB97_008787 [Aspergillus alliaceus]|uniref:Uncharacterized protein n=1 Tax=Petromyces alliaceus TaxID=209559 RepID=A0A8H6AD21_PETAA|nr:hypothetical protein ETB97_008787 [Aspergillus burnettii]